MRPCRDPGPDPAQQRRLVHPPRDLQAHGAPAVHDMIRTLRSFFLARFFREKVLLTGFAVLAAAIWLSSIAGRTNRFMREIRTTTASLNEQALWISNKGKIEAQAQAAAGRLDAARTLDAT